MSGTQDDNVRRPINNLVIELYKYQAESDRKRIKERQAQGIALAKEKGKFKGRKLKFTENDPRLQLAFKLYIMIVCTTVQTIDNLITCNAKTKNINRQE